MDPIPNSQCSITYFSFSWWIISRSLFHPFYLSFYCFVCWYGAKLQAYSWLWAQGTLWDAGHQIRIVCVQDRCPTCPNALGAVLRLWHLPTFLICPISFVLLRKDWGWDDCSKCWSMFLACTGANSTHLSAVGISLVFLHTTGKTPYPKP